MHTVARSIASAAIALAASVALPLGAAATAPASGPIVFEKVDAAGARLPGGTFAGLSCTRWDNDISWQCQSLNDYSWFDSGMTDAGFADQFVNDIPMRGGWALPVQHCIVLAEVTAPAGYVAATNPVGIFCQGPGGWTVANAAASDTLDGITLNGVQVTASGGDWVVSNDAETLASTFTLTNKAVPKPSPSAPPSPSVSPSPTATASPTEAAPGRGVPAHTGDETPSPLPLGIVLVAGAALVAVLRR